MIYSEGQGLIFSPLESRLAFSLNSRLSTFLRLKYQYNHRPKVTLRYCIYSALNILDHFSQNFRAFILIDFNCIFIYFLQYSQFALIS